MFDIGFSELIVIGIVALVVIGPERLPRVARATGLLFGRLQRYVNEVKADISREMQLEELKRLQTEVRETARDFERGMTDELQAIERSVEQTAAAARAGVQESAPSSGALPAPDEPADEEAAARREAPLPAAKE